MWRRAGLFNSVFIAAIGLAVLAGNAPASAHPAQRDRVSVGGKIPHVQAVGVPFWATLNLKNNGKRIKYPVLDLSGCTDHWVLDRIQTSAGATRYKSANKDAWELRPMPGWSRYQIRLLMVPKDAGNHNFDVALYSGWDKDTQIPLGNPLFAVGASVAVNP